MAKILLILVWVASGIAFALQMTKIARLRGAGGSSTRVGRAANWGICLQAAGMWSAWVPLPAAHPNWLDAIAIVLAVGSVTTMVLSVRELGTQWRVQAVVSEHHKLITTGPYSVVRNPIYAGLLGLLIATGLIMAPLWLAGVGVALYVLGTEIRVRVEEKLLREKFGAEFDRYCARVPAYVPFVR